MSKAFNVSIPDDDAEVLIAEAKQKRISPSQVLRDRALSTFREHSLPTPHDSTSKPVKRAENTQSKEIGQLWQELIALKEELSLLRSRANQPKNQDNNIAAPTLNPAGSLDSERLFADLYRHEAYLEAIYLLIQMLIYDICPPQKDDERYQFLEQLKQELGKIIGS